MNVSRDEFRFYKSILMFHVCLLWSMHTTEPTARALWGIMAFFQLPEIVLCGWRYATRTNPCETKSAPRG